MAELFFRAGMAQRHQRDWWFWWISVRREWWEPCEQRSRLSLSWRRRWWWWWWLIVILFGIFYLRRGRWPR